MESEGPASGRHQLRRAAFLGANGTQQGDPDARHRTDPELWKRIRAHWQDAPH